MSFLHNHDAQLSATFRAIHSLILEAGVNPRRFGVDFRLFSIRDATTASARERFHGLSEHAHSQFPCTTPKMRVYPGKFNEISNRSEIIAAK
jgi:hypothetical protein